MDMKTIHATKTTALLALAVLASANLSASEIYHWVDEDGVQHFSQQPPGSDTSNVSKQVLEDTAPPGDGQVEDVYNLAVHKEHMAEWREERDKQREEARKNKKLAANQQPQRSTETDGYYPWPYWRRPIYGKPPYRPPHRPPYRPPDNSERPIFNPRPPTTSLSGGGSR
jgi:hypothetical protein